MPRVWNPFDATRATSACGETFLPELRHGSYRRASFLQRLRNKNGMMYNSYFKERRNHGFLYKLRDKCPGWHKILYLMWYADVGTGTTASPATAPANLCAAAQPLPQQAYTPPSQPAYAQPQPGYVAPAGDPNAPLPPGSKYEPITTGGYIGIFLLMLLPLINLILLIIWACGGCQKVNKANFARAMLIMMIIGSVLSLLMFFAVRMLFGSEIDSLMEAFGDLLK